MSVITACIEGVRRAVVFARVLLLDVQRGLASHCLASASVRFGLKVGGYSLDRELGRLHVE
jgi:hypothetical protein